MNIPIYSFIYQLIAFSANYIHEEQQFRQFIKVYNKSYTLGSYEYWQRFLIFKESLEKINYLNSQRKQSTSALFGLTPFADLTLTEFKEKAMKRIFNQNNQSRNRSTSKRLLLSQSNQLFNEENSKPIIYNLPVQVDWRSKGIIGDVIAQGKCGSCWAHTTIETISSMVAIRTKQFTRYSAQQLLDCSDNNFGCNGGDLCEAIIWIVKNNVTLLKETDYPLRLDSGQCRQTNFSKGVQIESNFTCQSAKDHEENILQLIANHGPLMAAVDATHWQYYVNGTIHENCGTDANHAVQIVGYNLEADIPYYIARNTWGTNWGMDGYLQIAIGNNTCDIAAEVAAVWIKSID